MGVCSATLSFTLLNAVDDQFNFCSIRKTGQTGGWTERQTDWWMDKYTHETCGNPCRLFARGFFLYPEEYVVFVFWPALLMMDYLTCCLLTPFFAPFQFISGVVRRPFLVVVAVFKSCFQLPHFF